MKKYEPECEYGVQSGWTVYKKPQVAHNIMCDDRLWPEDGFEPLMPSELVDGMEVLWKGNILDYWWNVGRLAKGMYDALGWYVESYNIVSSIEVADDARGCIVSYDVISKAALQSWAGKK